MSLSACPDCGGNLGKSATKCRCGWKSAAAVQAEVSGQRGVCPCAADPACKLRGLLWVRSIPEDQRLCVVHYGIEIERNHDYAKDNDDLMKRMAAERARRFMPGVTAKPVAA